MRLALLTVACLMCIATVAAEKYEIGTLVDITHQDSNRTVGNATSTVTVTDREYNLSVRIRRMTYVGSYWPRWNWSYEPTDFVVNSQVKVRVTAKEMFVLRPDGKELRTKIIKRIANNEHPQ